MAENRQNQNVQNSIAQNESNQSLIKTDDSIYLHSSDHSSLVLVTVLLTEKNYTAWNRSIIALKARDKLGFLSGEFEIPTENDPKFKQWLKVNSTLISWIMNAMSPELGKGFVFATSAKDLWDEIRNSFGGCNGPRLYELRRNIYSAKQGNDSVTSYYNRIKRLWDELMCLKPSIRHSTAEEERMMQFLMRLNEEYDAIRNQILLKDPLPTN